MTPLPKHPLGHWVMQVAEYKGLYIFFVPHEWDNAPNEFPGFAQWLRQNNYKVCCMVKPMSVIGWIIEKI